MKKRGYTHIKELLPAIKVMVAEGKTQREIAEHFGFKDKEVVREAQNVSEEKKDEFLKSEDGSQQRHYRNINTRISD